MQTNHPREAPMSRTPSMQPTPQHQRGMALVMALLIGKALARYNGNISQAAEVLGLSRGTFYRRMEKYGFYVPSALRKEKQ